MRFFITEAVQSLLISSPRASILQASMVVVDIHTHAFPDAIAERAVPALAKAAAAPAYLDGKLESLIRSMDAANVDMAVVASIATKPGQFEAILNWSQSIASDRIIPFASVHPADTAVVSHLREIFARGIRGIKLHPYYQDFDLDDPALFPIYATLEELGLIVLATRVSTWPTRARGVAIR